MQGNQQQRLRRMYEKWGVINRSPNLCLAYLIVVLVEKLNNLDKVEGEHGGVAALLRLFLYVPPS